MGSAELASVVGQQGRGTTWQTRERASGLLRPMYGEENARAQAGALPDHRYKTEAPGALKALREAGGWCVTLELFYLSTKVGKTASLLLLPHRVRRIPKCLVKRWIYKSNLQSCVSHLKN